MTSTTEMELPDEILDQTLICLDEKQKLEARCISKNFKSLVDRRNGIKKIPDEILMHILIHLDTHEIFQARYVSKKFKSLVDQEEFWRRKYGPMFSLSKQTLSTPELKHLQQCCIVVANMEENRVEKKLWYLPNPPLLKCSTPCSLLPTQDECQYFHSRFKRICLASTQDREVEEISNVLATEEEDWSKEIITKQPESSRQISFLWSDSSWSSAPSVHSEPSKTNDVLLFGSKFGEAIITELAIKPEIDPEDIFFGVDEPKVYSWPQISIRIYCLPSNPQQQSLLFLDYRNQFSSHRPIIFEHSDFDSVRTPDGRLNHRGIIQNIVGNQVPVYVSPIMDVDKDVRRKNSWQVYSIPKGTIGNVVEITLYGKDVSHPVDNMFYACVERVAIRGVPLL